MFDSQTDDTYKFGDLQLNKSGDLEICLQGIEDEENRVLESAQIFADTLAEIRREAERIKKTEPGNRKPSAAKVIDRAWKLYRSSTQKVPVPGKPQQTVPMLYSLLPENVGKLSPGDLEWLRRLVGVAVERLNATDKEDERRNDSPADPDSIAEAARAEEDRAYKIAEKLRGVEPIDKPAPGRTGKRGGRPPKPTGGGGRD